MHKKRFLVSLGFLVVLVISALLFSATIARAAEPAPVVTSLSPDSGKQGQELEVHIFGENFAEGAMLYIMGMGIPPEVATFVSSNEIVFTITIAENATLGLRDVTVVNPDGQDYMLEEGFLVVDGTPPPAITGLTATDAFDGKIDMAWEPSFADDFAFYSIYMIYMGGEELIDVSGTEPLDTIADIDACSYQVTGLEDGTTYYFAVTVADVSGNEYTVVTPVSATPTTSYVPAPVLEMSGVTFIPAEPEAGDIVTITATVENTGDADATAVSFWFILDGVQIGEVVWTVPSGESVDVSYDWVATEGSHDFWAWVMGSDDTILAESPETTVDVAEAAGFPTLPVVLGIIGGLVLLGLGYWLIYWLRGRGQVGGRTVPVKPPAPASPKKAAKKKPPVPKKAGKKKKAGAAKEEEEFSVKIKRLKVLSEPDELMGETLEIISHGQVVEVIDFDSDETWQKVRTPKGTIGWVQTSAIDVQKRPAIRGKVAEGTAATDEEIGAGIKG